MKYVNYIFIPLIALSLSTNAEVFKCKNATGKTIYQSEPCASGATQQGVIKVKEMTPQEVEDSKARLKSWQEQQAADDAAKQEAEKQQQAELEKQESLELQRRSVIAQEQQAIAAQQRQNQPIIVAPPYGRGRYWNNGGFSSNGSRNPTMLPQQQPNIPWNHTPAGLAPAPMNPPAGQAPGHNGGGAGFHNR
ncbi:DUF4124 domain-containing protein [Methyloglobulus sp.]|uniref:DUF4124 domain-containing protein n=1 Tax=Methyloglobulus sp. TaxID=2518622 RepID=UPI0032B85577